MSVNCYLITALIERRKWMAWVLFGGERAHKRTEELAQHGGEAGKWGGTSSGRRESDSHVPPPQRTAAAGSGRQTPRQAWTWA